MAVPYLFANRTGNVPAEYLDDDFAYLAALIEAGGTVTAYTANHTVTAAQTGATLTNSGAVGTVTFTMPTPAAGLVYTFIVAAAQNVILDVGGSVVIAIGEIAGTPGGGASCNSPYSSVTLKAISTTLWVATSSIGSWTPS
jgi:hypothetical protein